MPSISYEKRQKIIAQSLDEIQWARTYKQGKVTNWKLNEDIYYGRKPQQDTSRANMDLGKGQEFVHSQLSKIDKALTFKFGKTKGSQLKRVARLNALRAIDAEQDCWSIKDLAGKKQAIIYGRAIYSYAADSVDGYRAHLANVDVYDFLIDPSAGGIDIEQAMYMGRYGVVKSKSELKASVKSKLYLEKEAKELIDGSGNSTDSSQEETNKLNRTADQNTYQTQKNIGNPDKYVFWEWYTTFEGERYYLLLNYQGATAVRIELLETLFKSEMWPFWTYATTPDLTEFWTPSPLDAVREAFMGQVVSINQLMDNAEQRNKPQRAVNTSAIKSLAQLKYQRGGNFVEIDLPQGTNVNTAIMTLDVPALDTPILVYNTLEAIHEKASGVTAGSKGDADVNGKATIYEGNQAAAGDRYGLLNKTYAFGYKRFAILYEHGVREHLVKRVAIDILGPSGVELAKVSRADIFHKNDKFRVIVESSDAETDQSELEKRTKIAFLENQAANPVQVQNPKKAYEIGATIAGFSEDEIRQLLDTSEFGNAELISEAEGDIEAILEGKKIPVNQQATIAYKQHFIDYMQDNQEDLSTDNIRDLFAYMDELNPVIIRNMQRDLAERQLMQAASQPVEPPETPTASPVVQPATQAPPEPAQPVQPPVQQPPTVATINQIAPNGQ